MSLRRATSNENGYLIRTELSVNDYWWDNLPDRLKDGSKDTDLYMIYSNIYVSIQYAALIFFSTRLAGVLFMKISKMAAFVLGAGLLTLQVSDKSLTLTLLMIHSSLFPCVFCLISQE